LQCISKKIAAIKRKSYEIKIIPVLTANNKLDSSTSLNYAQWVFTKNLLLDVAQTVNHCHHRKTHLHRCIVVWIAVQGHFAGQSVWKVFSDKGFALLLKKKVKTSDLKR